MRKVTFRFPDTKSLQLFVATISDKFMQISLTDLTITCNCEEAEVELAVNGFNAEVLNKELNLE